jgi:hypothetical protein
MAFVKFLTMLMELINTFAYKTALNGFVKHPNLEPMNVTKVRFIDLDINY